MATIIVRAPLPVINTLSAEELAHHLFATVSCEVPGGKKTSVEEEEGRYDVASEWLRLTPVLSEALRVGHSSTWALRQTPKNRRRFASGGGLGNVNAYGRRKKVLSQGASGTPWHERRLSLPRSDIFYALRGLWPCLVGNNTVGEVRGKELQFGLLMVEGWERKRPTPKGVDVVRRNWNCVVVVVGFRAATP